MWGQASGEGDIRARTWREGRISQGKVGRKPSREKGQPVQSHVHGVVDMAMNEDFQWVQTD